MLTSRLTVSVTFDVKLIIDIYACMPHGGHQSYLTYYTVYCLIKLRGILSFFVNRFNSLKKPYNRLNCNVVLIGVYFNLFEPFANYRVMCILSLTNSQIYKSLKSRNIQLLLCKIQTEVFCYIAVMFLRLSSLMINILCFDMNVLFTFQDTVL